MYIPGNSDERNRLLIGYRTKHIDIIKETTGKFHILPKLLNITHVQTLIKVSLTIVYFRRKKQLC